jgi:hypothetical protein
MKRSQAASPVAEKRSNKKAKLSAGTAQNMGTEDSEGWTKVEKRKQKKTQKQEVKSDVNLTCLSTDNDTNFPLGNATPIHVRQQRDCEAESCHRH